MKTNPKEEKARRKLQILVSETKRGVVIKEKLGHILLWRKETDNRNKIYVIEIRKLICKKCNHLIELPMPKKIFKMMADPSSHSEVCDSCGQLNEYKFGEGQTKAIKI